MGKKPGKRRSVGLREQVPTESRHEKGNEDDDTKNRTQQIKQLERPVEQGISQVGKIKTPKITTNGNPKSTGKNDNHDTKIETSSWYAPAPKIKIPLDIGNKELVTLTLDTGAEISLLREDSLGEKAKVDTSRKFPINTVYGKSTTKGSCVGTLPIGPDSGFKCEFQVADNPENLQEDGLLGINFLSKHCKIDGPNKLVEFPVSAQNSREFSIPFANYAYDNSEIYVADDLYDKAFSPQKNIPTASKLRAKNTQCSSTDGKTSKNSNAVGKTPNLSAHEEIESRLSKNNAKCSQNTYAKNGDKKRSPTQPFVRSAKTHTSGNELERVAIVISSSVLSESHVHLADASENLRNDTAYVNVGQKEIQGHKVSDQQGPDQEIIKLKLNPTILVPARAQKIITVPYQSPCEMICDAHELQPGIFIANGILKSHKGKTQVGILNNNFSDYKLEEIILRLDKLTNFMVEPFTQATKECQVEPEVKGKGIRIQRTAAQDSERIKQLHKEVLIDETLNQEEKNSLLKICENFHDIFHMTGDKLTCTTAIEHEIPILSDQAPINQKMYRLPETQKEIINTQVSEMLDSDIIQHSKSPWNSPLLVVPKKVGADGVKRWRVVVDFRKLNDKTVGDVFPLPRIEDILDQLGRARYFTTLDMASGYHQVLVKPEDRPKTAFSTPYGHYEFKRMPFGLKGAPATFQRMMNHVLTGLTGTDAFVYLDDVVIHARNLNDHNEKLTRVFNRFRRYNLKLNPLKCQFLRKEVIYLGHKCTNEGALPDPSKVECVHSFPAPRTVRQVQAFLGLANYYRKFIPNFSAIVRPITNLLKKDVKFDWDTSCQKAFEEVKQCLVSPPILIYPDFSKPFNLTTDASNTALGAVLSQGKVGEDKPIAYASRTLNKAERNYSTIEKELLGVVWAVRNFRCYLLGRSFTIYTDHKPLKGILNRKRPSVPLDNIRLVNFMTKLSEFEFEIEYKPGKYNTNADALSRMPENTEEKPVNCTAVTRQQAQREREKLSEQNKQEKSNSGSDESSEEEEEAEISLGQGITEYLSDPEEIQEVLRSFHDSPLGGHQGIRRTTKRIRRQYTWKNMAQDVRKYVKNCPTCQKTKASLSTKMPLIITDTPEKPFDKVHMDIVGPLEQTNSGNKYILTFQDNLTKFVDWYAISEIDANTVAKIFCEEIITRYRIPKVLLTDQGTNFTSQMFKKVCKFLKVHKIQTTAYHPQTNGSLERAHRPLIEYLRATVQGNPRIWDEYLRAAAFVYNNSEHEATKLTPMDCLFGFTSEVPTNLKRPPVPVYNHEEYFFKIRHKLQKMYEIARKNQISQKERAKKYYDRNVRITEFKVGDLVLLRNEMCKGKLADKWRGPYQVVEIPNEVNTVIQAGKRTIRVHNNRLKKYQTEETN